MSCEFTVNARPEQVYAAWTERFDTWFAQAGTLMMVAEPGRPYFFYNRDDWGRHPHYGRILDVKENQLIEMTWMTGRGPVTTYCLHTHHAARRKYRDPQRSAWQIASGQVMHHLRRVAPFQHSPGAVRYERLNPTGSEPCKRASYVACCLGLLGSESSACWCRHERWCPLAFGASV